MDTINIDVEVFGNDNMKRTVSIGADGLTRVGTYGIDILMRKNKQFFDFIKSTNVEIVFYEFPSRVKEVIFNPETKAAS